MIDALLAVKSACGIRCVYPAQSTASDHQPAEIHYHYPTADDIEQIYLNNFRRFRRWQCLQRVVRFLDQNPHNTHAHLTGDRIQSLRRPNSLLPLMRAAGDAG